MLAEGAVILDLGGLAAGREPERFRMDEELRRVVPAIQLLAGRFPAAFISVDSYRYKVAEAALEAGAPIINDIGASKQENLAALAASKGVPYICMHMRGNPRTCRT